MLCRPEALRQAASAPWSLALTLGHLGTDSPILTPPTDHFAANGAVTEGGDGLGLFVGQVDHGPGDQVGGLSGDQWAVAVVAAWGVGHLGAVTLTCDNVMLLKMLAQF